MRFWRGRRVFLTGHTGFKGAWLALWLRRLGAEVCGYALAPATQPSAFELFGLAREMESVIGDVRDPQALRGALRAKPPSIVFHLASQALVREGYRDPLGTFASNVQGTANLLDALRDVDGVAAIVVVTSDKVYRNHEGAGAYRESDTLGGNDPYSASKACAEIVSAAYRASFFGGSSAASIATARAGNVIGGGDWSADRLVPDILRALQSGAPPELRYPHARRPWQHVLEPLLGYLLLAQHLTESGSAYAEAWNFGPPAGAGWTVAQITEAFLQSWGARAGWHEAAGAQPHESLQLAVDATKSSERLGWRSRLSTESSVELTVEWYRRWAAGADVRACSEAQIGMYEAL